MTKQIVHTRHSKYGRPFNAGSRIQQKDDIEEINVLNILKTESEEPKEEDIKTVMEQTGEEDRGVVIEKLKEMENDISQTIEELMKEDEEKGTDENLEVPEIEDD